MLADRFTQEDERSKAMAYAITGLSLGVVIGPPFGGFMYEFFDKKSPFLVICFLTLIDGCEYFISLELILCRTLFLNSSLLIFRSITLHCTTEVCYI